MDEDMRLELEDDEDDEEEAGYTVYIKRQLRGYDGQDIKVSKLWGGHVGNVTGGVHQYYSCCKPYMAYVDPDDAPDVACSRRHNYASYGIKVCVIQKYSSKEGMEEFCRRFGLETPRDRRRAYKPSGKVPCSKQILQFLQEAEGEHLCRGELRERMKGLDYEVPTIRNALKRMEREGRIKTIGSSQKPDQVIQFVTAKPLRSA